jgi:hypothetical protein
MAVFGVTTEVVTCALVNLFLVRKRRLTATAA